MDHKKIERKRTENKALAKFARDPKASEEDLHGVGPVPRRWDAPSQDDILKRTHDIPWSLLYQHPRKLVGACSLENLAESEQTHGAWDDMDGEGGVQTPLPYEGHAQHPPKAPHFCQMSGHGTKWRLCGFKHLQSLLDDVGQIVSQHLQKWQIQSSFMLP